MLSGKVEMPVSMWQSYYKEKIEQSLKALSTGFGLPEKSGRETLLPLLGTKRSHSERGFGRQIWLQGTKKHCPRHWEISELHVTGSEQAVMADGTRIKG